MTSRIARPIRTVVAALMLCASACAWPLAAAQAPPPDAVLRETARRGIDMLMDGNPDAAIEVFHEIQRTDPQSPLGYLLEADAMWWKIYYTTANLADPDVFSATDLSSTPYDARFEDMVNTTVAKADQHIHEQRDVARNHLYAGLAFAMRARLHGLRDKALPTARAGKKMRSLLLEALKLDPGLTDAYLGIGIYNYFVDTLPTIVKMLKFLIGLPGGNRALGLQQLQQAAEQGDLARGEAKFYLAKDYSRPNERQYAKSLQLFEELGRDYPHNALWQLVVGSLHFRIGQPEKGEAIYREVLKKTARGKTDADKAVHRAAIIALQRIHAGETFE